MKGFEDLLSYLSYEYNYNYTLPELLSDDVYPRERWLELANNAYDIFESFLCLDCGSNTAPGGDGLDEYYMIENEVWCSVNPSGEGMLCVGCLEDRLGRKLSPEDFTDCPLNKGNKVNSSPRLMSRINR